MQDCFNDAGTAIFEDQIHLLPRRVSLLVFTFPPPYLPSSVDSIVNVIGVVLE